MSNKATFAVLLFQFSRVQVEARWESQYVERVVHFTLNGSNERICPSFHSEGMTTTATLRFIRISKLEALKHERLFVIKYAAG